MSTPNKLSLYGITDEMKTLDELIAMEGGEITPEIEALEKEVLDLLTMKTDNFVGYINHLNDEIEAGKKRIAEFQTFVKYRENAVKYLKNYVVQNMEKLDTKKIAGDFSSISYVKPRQNLEVFDIDKIPAEYLTRKVEMVVDKKELLSDLKNNNIDCKGARIIHGAPSVRFNMKSAK